MAPLLRIKILASDREMRLGRRYRNWSEGVVGGRCGAGVVGASVRRTGMACFPDRMSARLRRIISESD